MDALTLRVAFAHEGKVAALIDTHFQLMRGSSPEDSCHVLPADALGDAYMVAVEQGGNVIGVGALQQIGAGEGAGEGEIKSMHTAASARGKGVARMILRALVAEAKARQMTRLNLETGSAKLFAPARALYASEGFTPCAPFGSYTADPHSVFMTRAI